MAANNPHGREVILELLRKFPNTPTLTLAKKAYKENKSVWISVEACRSAVRDYRGNHGNRQHSRTRVRDHYRKPHKAGELTLPTLPKAIRHITDRDAFQIDTPGRWLILSDIHLPYHDEVALMAVIRHAKRLGVVGVLLNGDTQDFYAISRWETDPRKRDFCAEIDTGVEFRRVLRETFGKKCRIVEKMGNHDERLELYLMRKAPELLDLEAMQYGKLLGLENAGIELIGEKRPIRLGKLFLLHGHEYRGGFIPPVGAARWLYLRTNDSALCGHFHQSSTYAKKTVGDHIIGTWSTGCLCDLKPLYARLNDWNHGAATVEVGKDGSYRVNNFKVIDGEVW